MIQYLLLNPTTALLISAILMCLLKSYKRAVQVIAIMAPILSLLCLSQGAPSLEVDIAYVAMNLIHYDGYNTMLASVFIVATLVGSLYALSCNQIDDIIIGHFYSFAAISAIISGDFLGLFIALEAMMIFSTILIFISIRTEARASAMRYFIMHMIASICFLTGLILLYSHEGSREVTAFNSEIFSIGSAKEIAAAALILLACLINVGAPPFSAWISDSYPLANTSGTIFLISLTTKVNIFLLAKLFAGQAMLVTIGVAMFCYGIIMAILEGNIRRIIAFLTISQLGFMISAIGIGSDLIIKGVIILACCHVLYNSIFITIAGSIFDLYKIENFDHINRVQKSKDRLILTAVFAVGSSMFLAVPMTILFPIKNHIMIALSHYSFEYYIAVVVFGSLSLLAFPWKELLIPSDSRARVTKMPLFNKIALLFPAVTLVLISILSLYYDFTREFEYSYSHVANQLSNILVTVLMAVIFSRASHKIRGIILDFDFIYRKIFALNLMKFPYDSYKSYGYSRISQLIAKITKGFYRINYSYSKPSYGLGLLVAAITLALLIIIPN